MTKVYPITITLTDKNAYVVYVPDLEINTVGYSMAEALLMARDAICLVIIVREDEGLPVAEPSTEPPKCEPGDIVAWVDVDPSLYRVLLDTASVRTNVTMPRYLKELAQRAGLNLSQELQARLKQTLGLEGKSLPPLVADAIHNKENEFPYMSAQD